MVMRQILPGGAPVAVIFTNGSPGSLTEVRVPIASSVRYDFPPVVTVFLLPSRCLSFRVAKPNGQLLDKGLCQNLPFDYPSSPSIVPIGTDNGRLPQFGRNTTPVACERRTTIS